MRIAFFHHYSLTHGGGGERFLLELANFLARKGHRIEIHALPFRGRNVPFQLEPGARYCEGLLHRADADVSYHVYAPLVSHAFMCNAPRIAGLHGAVVADYASPASFYFHQGPFVAGAYVLRQTIGKIDLEAFDAVHAVSPVPVSHGRLYVLPNWVNCSNTARALEAKRTRPETFGVLYVGKPSYTKGFDIVTALAESLAGNGIEFWAAFPPEPGFHGDDHVKWLGYLPHEDMWRLYARAAVLLHPTRQETFGRAILESLAAGTPVITTPIPSHVSLGLPLQYASTVSEARDKIDELHRGWATDYEGYLHAASAAAKDVGRFDAQTLLPRYEQMLFEVARGGPS